VACRPLSTVGDPPTAAGGTVATAGITRMSVRAACGFRCWIGGISRRSLGVGDNGPGRRFTLCRLVRPTRYAGVGHWVARSRCAAPALRGRLLLTAGFRRLVGDASMPHRRYISATNTPVFAPFHRHTHRCPRFRRRDGRCEAAVGCRHRRWWSVLRLQPAHAPPRGAISRSSLARWKDNVTRAARSAAAVGAFDRGSLQLDLTCGLCFDSCQVLPNG
jgi:hypothetical protein